MVYPKTALYSLGLVMSVFSISLPALSAPRANEPSEPTELASGLGTPIISSRSPLVEKTETSSRSANSIETRIDLGIDIPRQSTSSQISSFRWQPELRNGQRRSDLQSRSLFQSEL
ncbi:hypothetical protein C1752_14879 [Acaryochloris thomasi RCC1774]|uniref:Uncharacterized protein n=1 Tax=Acaryochloris thomasi RCC1774 TaxID=1764569 RepID=A0A2W1J7V5_9CYAN|nr:hypothetical protein [Acaryochloris thomasi]PZD70266.1 hypothetical protein C1752_14879 [Acaryochloris thomasi RCC1774]